MNGPEVLVPIAFFAMVVTIVLGVPLVRARIRERERHALNPVSDPHDVDRLARMEATLEAVALEVERISEGQRFVTKLLAERTAPGPLPAPTERAP